MAKIRKIKSNLLDDEKILYAASMHWGIFIAPGILTIIGSLLWVFFHPIVGGALLLITLVPIINSAILYATTEYGVTTKRTLAFYGLFTTDLMQIGHDKLESAHVEQTFIGQILGYYTVIARGTGQGSIAVPFLTDGDKLKKVLDEIIYADDREEVFKKIQKKISNGDQSK